MIAFLVIAESLYATTYYVSSQNGQDKDTGTSRQHPWRTLDKINATQFSPGDQILFSAGGIWDGQLNPSGSGIAGNPIVISQYGNGSKPAIRGPGSNRSAALLLNNQEHWEINDLDLSNWQPVGGINNLYGIHITGGGDKLWHHIYIRNCYVHDVNSPPGESKSYDKNTGGIIFNLNPEDVLVENCCVSNVSVEGLRTSSSPNSSKIIFRGNVVEDVYGDGIVLHGSSGGSIIERNTVRHACIGDDRKKNWAALWTFASTHTLVQFNEVYGTAGGGINDGEAFDADIDDDGDIFQYNYSHDNARGFMLLMNGAKNIIIRYNISQNDAREAAPVGGHRLFFQDQGIGNASNHIYNNVFYVDGDLDCVFFKGHNITFNNNIIYCTGRVGKFSTIPMSTNSVFMNNCFYPAALTALNGPAGTVSDNIFADPMFTAPGNGLVGMKIGPDESIEAPNGYRLKVSSPALGSGLVIAENGGRDYYGNSFRRVSHPNIGAYQDKGLTSFTFLPLNEDTK